ncbi:MAG: hypothetical protein GZ094_02735 [Mariniphaga sp.]|nr:hypothetical protein [Mariniphaga sp.]
MKPSKRLTELSLQFYQLKRQQRELISEIETLQHEYFKTLIGDNKLNADELHKFNELRKTIAQILGVVTSMESSICKKLDKSLDNNNERFLSDYEFFISQQFCGRAGRLPLKLKSMNKHCKIYEDHILIYNDYSKEPEIEHINWREEEKADKLYRNIRLIDSVDTEIEVWYQFMLDYRKGKWVKCLYPAKCYIGNEKKNIIRHIQF